MERYTYLAHYGIPKMKWGVRRFQNLDGTLTEEGRRRYLKSDGRMTRSGLKAFKKREKEYWDDSDKKGRPGWKNEAARAEKRLAVYDRLTNKADKIDSLELEALSAKEQSRLRDAGERWCDDFFAAYDLQMTALYMHQDVRDNGVDFVTRKFAGLADSDQERYKNSNDEFRKIADSDVVKKYPHDTKAVGTIGEAGYWNPSLFDKINNESIDWYNSSPKSESAKKLLKKYGWNPDDKYSYPDNVPREEILKVVLGDLGIPDTPKNRDAIREHVFWD